MPPGWQPNWSDVRWDWAAASAAVWELRRVASLLDETATARMHETAIVRQLWKGAFYRRFEPWNASLLQRTRELAEEYRAYAAQIERASTAAHLEQEERVRQRRRWHDENDSDNGHYA